MTEKERIAERDSERIYPCEKCGKLRSKDEGGLIFTTCDACWGKYYRKNPEPLQVWTTSRIDEDQSRGVK